MRRRRCLRGLRQQGVAVVTALLLTTLAVTIVGSLFWQQQVQVRSIENQRLQLQKQWILRGALDWARLILREDARLAGAVDTLDEPWSVPLAQTRLDQYVEDAQADSDAAEATLSGAIVDAQARYNLRNLVYQGAINESELAVFEKLLGLLNIDPGLALATAVLLQDSEAPPGMPSGRGLRIGGQSGGQSGGQGGGQAPATPELIGMVYVDDLLAVPGFTPEALEKLREHVIFLPRTTSININTASAEVLAARIDTLSLAEAQAVVKTRASAYFRNVADLRLLLQDKGGAVHDADLAVATRYFLINGQVSMRRAGLEVQALVERDGLKTRLVWIREY